MIPWDPRALAVVRCLEEAGHRAVLVGGCVRDSLLSRPPHDYDAATSARPEEILSACGRWRCLDVGIRHGTVTVLADGLPVEVTTFRREGRYSDHRRPDQVSFTHSLEEDLARRDFTVNAMAWGSEGLIDPFGGRADLEQGVVRCVGEPDRRFEEDALRVLRGLRLAAQLSFSLCPDTAAALRRHVPQLSFVAWERISAEWIRLLCAPAAGDVLLAFPEAAVQVLPELGPCVGFDQRNPHHCWDVYTHSVKALEQVAPVPALRPAALLHDAGKPAVFTLDETGTGHFYGHPRVSAELARDSLTRLRLDTALREGTFTLAGTEIRAVGNDAECFLMQWGSAKPENLGRYANSAYDTLLSVIAGAEEGEARMGCLHDAEALLLEEGAAAPLDATVTGWTLRDGLSGVLRDARGWFSFAAAGRTA